MSPNGNFHLEGSCNLSGESSLNGTVSINGMVTILGYFSINGMRFEFIIEDPASFNGSILLGGNASLEGDFYINGTISLIPYDESPPIDEVTFINGTVLIEGKLYLGGYYVAEHEWVNLEGTISLTGKIRLDEEGPLIPFREDDVWIWLPRGNWTFFVADENTISLGVGQVGRLYIASDKPSVHPQLVTVVCSDGTTFSVSVRR